jgi:hypothetical protein
MQSRHVVSEIDALLTSALTAFAADALGSRWCGKEHEWVNRFAHSYLLKHCAPNAVLHDPGQLTIEVGVPQPPGYTKSGTRRDLVIWESLTPTCWNEEWVAVHHPIAIVEWKVHRPKRRNRDVLSERDWLRRYTEWQRDPVAYAVAIDLECTPESLVCSRFHAGDEQPEWLRITAR